MKTDVKMLLGFDGMSLSGSSSCFHCSNESVLSTDQSSEFLESSSSGSTHPSSHTSPASVLERLQEFPTSCSELSRNPPNAESETETTDSGSCLQSPAAPINNQPYRCLATVKAYSGSVCSLALMSNGILYSGSDSSTIRLWHTPRIIPSTRSFSKGDGAVKAILIHANKIYSAHQDSKIRVWSCRNSNTCDLQAIATLPTIKDYLTTFALPKNYVQVRRHHRRLWIDHVDAIAALAVGNDGLLYSGSWDKTLKVWRLADGRCVESIVAHDDAVTALTVGSGGRVYSASADRKVKSWRRSKKRLVLASTGEKHKAAVNALALAADESLLYSASSDGAILTWFTQAGEEDLKSGGECLKGHTAAVLCMVAIPNGLCSGSADKTIRVWGRRVGGSHECMAVLGGHVGGVRSMAVGMDSGAGCTIVYSGGMDGYIKSWCISPEVDALSDLEEIQPKPPHPCSIR